MLVLEPYISDLCDLQKKARKWIRPFLVVSAIYLGGIIAIIRANFNYIDDMGRVMSGYKEWDNFSRYLSVSLSGIIHADNYLTDISPLTQIIAIIILSFSALIILYLFTERQTFNFWHYIAIVPLGLSPYFLECISYKYDAPYMALSILASVIPLILRKKHVLMYGITSILSIIVVCTTYQAASGIFPMLVIVLSLRDWTKGEDHLSIFKYWCSSVVGYVVGLIIFKFFIMHPADTYVSSSINISQAFDHLEKYYEILQSDFKKEWLVLLGIITVAFAVAMVKNSIKNKVATCLLSVCSLIIMYVLAFGLYPVLSEPLYAPRAMYGLGVLVSFLMVEVSSEIRIYWGKIVSLILSWMFFVFAFTYGNALYVQKQYTDYRITMVAEAINDLNICQSEQQKELQIVGTIGYAPAIRNMPQDYNILNRLIPITFRGEWYWGACGLLNYYDLKYVESNLGTDFSDLNLPTLKTTTLYTIRADDTHILIELTE